MPLIPDIVYTPSSRAGSVTYVALALEKRPWFEEIAVALVEALIDRGHDAHLIVDHVDRFIHRWSAPFGVARAWIVLTPELFSRMPPTRAVAYNLEQLDARAIDCPKGVDQLARISAHASTIWDFSTRNMAFWTSRGLACEHAPLGYSPCMSYPRSLAATPPRMARCMFIGYAYGCRIKKVEALRARLGDDRFAQTNASFCFGDARSDLLAGSAQKIVDLSAVSIVVNLKSVEPSISCLETSRLWSCVANRVLVLSELDDDFCARAPFEAAGMYFAPFDELLETVCVLMNESVASLQSRADAIFDQLRRSMRFANVIPELRF